MSPLEESPGGKEFAVLITMQVFALMTFHVLLVTQKEVIQLAVLLSHKK